MKMTLKEVTTKHAALMGLAGKKLPIKISYAVTKNLIKLEEEAKLIEKNRLELAEQYAEKGEDGKAKLEENSYVLGDNRDSFLKEYAEYLETETEIEVRKISVAELEKLEDVRYDVLSLAELAAMEFMLEESEA